MLQMNGSANTIKKQEPATRSKGFSRGKLKTILHNGNVDETLSNQQSHYEKLLAAKAMLNDPQLEEFGFIHPGVKKNTKKRNAWHAFTASRRLAIIKPLVGGNPTRKLLKVKVKMPKLTKYNQKKIKSTLLYPGQKNKECQWSTKSLKFKILFIPRRCLRSFKHIYEQIVVENGHAFGYLLPRHSRLGKYLTRELLKNSILINYGRRTGILLEELAARNTRTKFIITKQS
eukprot:gene18360-20206_t